MNNVGFVFLGRPRPRLGVVLALVLCEAVKDRCGGCGGGSGSGCGGSIVPYSFFESSRMEFSPHSIRQKQNKHRPYSFGLFIHFDSSIVIF